MLNSDNFIITDDYKGYRLTDDNSGLYGNLSYRDFINAHNRAVNFGEEYYKQWRERTLNKINDKFHK